MRFRRPSSTQIIRHVVQAIAFVLMPGLFISTFSAVGDVVSALVHGSFSLVSQAQSLLLLLGVLPITILWGRFFCGYLCSFGVMGALCSLRPSVCAHAACACRKGQIGCLRGSSS